MPIPDYQSIMLPLLKLTGDGETHAILEAINTLADTLGIDDVDRLQRLPSGKQRMFDNRVRWAKTYLMKAGLLECPARGYFAISDRGIEVLGKPPSHIDVEFLLRYPEFQEFRGGSGSVTSGRSGVPESSVSVATPEELLEATVGELRASLAKELLDNVKSASPQFFERLVVMLLVAMGYGGSHRDAGQAIGGSGDGGIDGLIKEDRLGLDVIYLQAKRWENTVGSKIVREFAGSLEGMRAQRGVLITTSVFSREAREFVTKIEKKIILIDGDKLTELMIDHNVGVSAIASYEVKKVDIDFFIDE